MKKLYLLLAIMCVIIVLAYESGPFPENTSAPNEMTCYRSGCHTNNGSGNASVFLQFNDSSITYENMDTVLMRIGFDKSFSNEHGFQMVALDSLNQNVGSWLASGSNQIQVINGFSFPNRKYVQHTIVGTNNNNWLIEWVSPDTYRGKITFYASFLETNEDDTRNGDTLYNGVLTVEHEPTSGISVPERFSLQRFRTYTSSKRFFIENLSSQILHGKIFNVSGNLVFSFKNDGYEFKEISLQTGLYVLAVQTGNPMEFETKKFVIY